MTLDIARTKSKRARKIFLPKQMQRQQRSKASTAQLFFLYAKSARFSENAATQHLV
jgi:integrase/recombinase XerD